MLTRRQALYASAAGLGVLAIGRLASPHAARATTNYEVTHTDAEWHKLLTPAQYDVLRQEGTERPFTSELLKEHRDGTFACAGCDLPLFSSKTKFESGTGWPSFWAPLDKAVDETTDRSFGMSRTEAGTTGRRFRQNAIVYVSLGRPAELVLLRWLMGRSTKDLRASRPGCRDD